MKRNVFFILVFALGVNTSIKAQIDQNNDRKMAIYLSGSAGDLNYQANLVSMKQIGAVSGLPFIITSDFVECLDYGVILFSDFLNENFLNDTQKQQLTNYVENGGGVIFSGLNDPDLFELAGLESASIGNGRHFMTFKSSQSDPELRWIDEPYEREIKLGSGSGGIYPTLAYHVSSGEVFALYRNSNQAAMVRNQYGAGWVYTFGFAWRDVIIRNLLDRDFQANRYYSNSFEATADVFMLMIRGIVAKIIPNTVWLSPAPYDSKAVFIITHDVCSHTAHIFSNDFAQMEYNRGISATYNITTHQFIDDINGDNYSSHIPQMKLLLHKNHVIGSHSYGHFPDFGMEEVFPVGESVPSFKDYHPHFSTEEGRTVGGTVYGELGVSKKLLETDLNIEVKMHRSGHLVVNPEQYRILDELGYKYSSSFTSADLLTAFPFYAHLHRGMNEPQLPIIEIPLTISDVFGSQGAAIDEFNWLDKAKLWLSVLNSYANNNSFTNLLVHPNRKYKLDAIVYVLDHMPTDVYPMELTAYAEFWKAKEQIRFSSKLEDRVLKIFVNDAFFTDDAYSFVYDAPTAVDEVEIYNSNNQLISTYERNYYLGTAMLYQKGISDLKKRDVAIDAVDELLHQNYPNPFMFNTTIQYQIPETSFVNLQILDMYGRVVEELVNQNQSAGIFNLNYSSKNLSTGMYFYQIHVQSEHNYYTTTRKMMVR